MNIKPVTEIGANRALCVTTVRVAAGLKTYEAKRHAYRREQLGVPIGQCAARADFLVDGKPTCRQHTQQAALAHMLQAGHERTDEEHIARPLCGCPSATARRVIIEHGTCGRGGCPYGGDF